MGIFGGQKISRKKYESEVSNILKRLDKCRKANDNTCTSWSYQTIAKLSEEIGEHKKSIDYLLQAVSYSLKDRRYFNVGWLYKLASSSAEKDNDLEKAIEYAAKSAEFFEKSKNRYAAQWSYNVAAKLSEKKKDFNSAIKYYTKYNEIDSDKEIEEKIKDLKDKLPHPVILIHTDKDGIEEGDEVEFTVEIDNNSRFYLSNVRLMENKSDIYSIDTLKPKEKREFKYKTTGKVGILRPSFNKVVWMSGGKQFEKDVYSFGIRVKPCVKVKAAVNPPLRLNRPSDFVLVVKNLSSSSLKDVKFFVNFPKDFVVKKYAGNVVDTIKPGDEKGLAYSLTPKTVGRTTLNDISIDYTDDYGVRYETHVNPVVLEETISDPLGSGKENNVQKESKHLEFEANPIMEEDYVSLANKYKSVEKGFTLNNISIDHLAEHVLDECCNFTLIGHHDHKDERLFMFSGRREGKVYLLTVALSKKGELVNMVFKLYSEDEIGLGGLLDKISENIRYIAASVSAAKEIQKIEVSEVINIIDSIVQRSNIGQDTVKDKDVRIKDSIVQRSGV